MVQEGEQANVIVGGLNIPNAVNVDVLDGIAQLQGDRKKIVSTKV